MHAAQAEAMAAEKQAYAARLESKLLQQTASSRRLRAKLRSQRVAALAASQPLPALDDTSERGRESDHEPMFSELAAESEGDADATHDRDRLRASALLSAQRAMRASSRPATPPASPGYSRAGAGAGSGTGSGIAAGSVGSLGSIVRGRARPSSASLPRAPAVTPTALAVTARAGSRHALAWEGEEEAGGGELLAAGAELDLRQGFLAEGLGDDGLEAFEQEFAQAQEQRRQEQPHQQEQQRQQQPRRQEQRLQPTLPRRPQPQRQGQAAVAAATRSVSPLVRSLAAPRTPPLHRRGGGDSVGGGDGEEGEVADSSTDTTRGPSVRDTSSQRFASAAVDSALADSVVRTELSGSYAVDVRAPLRQQFVEYYRAQRQRREGQ